MAGQAGWYRAPGEAGMLRYWNGTTWTDHRQADPAAMPVEAPRLIAEDPDPMAEYERQFETPTPSFDLPIFSFDQRQFEETTPVADSIAEAPAAPLPQYRPLAALAPAPAPAPEFAGAPTSVPRSFVPRPAPVASEFEQVLIETQAISQAPKAPAHREPFAVEAAPSIAPAASAPAGLAPSRRAVVRAFRGMVIALAVILIGIGAMVFFGSQSLAGSGEVKTTGIVTSLGLTNANSCTPVARFAVKGRSFTANSNTAITPCPVGLGQGVDVIYSAANPAAAARIQLGTSLTEFLWLLPVLGGLFFLASLITFIVRAGSIVAGIRLVRTGDNETDESATAA